MLIWGGIVMARYISRSVVALTACIAIAGPAAIAATIPLLSGSPPMDVSTPAANLNAVINTLNANVPRFGSLPAGTRNYLDNGAMAITQPGTGAVTGASTAARAVLSYVADRWCVGTNVTSGG